MRITESKLRQIIREEAELRIVKQTITEVVSEMQIDLTEEQRILLEQSVLDALKKATGNNFKLIAFMAAAAFGSQIGNDLQVLNDVGVTPSIGQQMSDASTARDYVQALKDKELQKAVQTAIDRGTADLGVDSGDEKRVSDTDNFVQKYQGDLEMATGANGRPLRDPVDGAIFYYVPYDNIDSTYTDFSTGKSGIDGKLKYYSMMAPDKLDAFMDKNLQSFGSFGYGKFKTVGSTADANGNTVPIKLLNADYSAFQKAHKEKPR